MDYSLLEQKIIQWSIGSVKPKSDDLLYADIFLETYSKTLLPYANTNKIYDVLALQVIMARHPQQYIDTQMFMRTNKGVFNAERII